MQILEPDILKNETQIIIVDTKYRKNNNNKYTINVNHTTDAKDLEDTEDIENSKTKVYMCEKVNNKWITIMETNGFIGKNGLGKEREGDLKTPIGLYEIGIAFGTADIEQIDTKLDYYKLNENMYWICDSNSKYYNQFIDTNNIKSDNINIQKIDNSETNNLKIGNIKLEPDWDNSKNEHLIEEDIAYAFAIEIKYNKEAIPGKGSAIFLHCIKNGPTAGCVSISKECMKFVLENIEKNTKIYIK